MSNLFIVLYNVFDFISLIFVVILIISLLFFVIVILIVYKLIRMNVNNVKSKRKIIINDKNASSINTKDSGEFLDAEIEQETLFQPCPYCGGSVPKNSKHCQLCGAEIV